MIRISHFIVAIAILFFVILTIVFLKNTTALNFRQPIDSSIWADYGTILGGFCSAALSMASVYLIIRSIKEQRGSFEEEQLNQKEQFQTTITHQNAQLKKQSLYIEKQQIESRFFELLKIHRENSNEIIIGSRHGKRALVSLAFEFETAFDVVAKTVDSEFSQLKVSLLEMIDIAYLCFFFGIEGKVSKRILSYKLEKYSEKGDDFVTTILDALLELKRRNEAARAARKNKERNQQENCSTENEVDDDTEKKFGHKILDGNQSRLSHYLRHLHQTVKFINDKPQEVLTYKEKYDYIRILRAQLSIQEQALLFFNSLSQIGGTWGKKEGLNPEQDFITKYNLIKNIPKGFLDNYELFSYYPNLAFTEGDLSKEERKEFEYENFN